MPTTLAIDFGSRYIGLALVEHGAVCPNRVLYAATILVESKPLNALTGPRTECRRLRRTRKTQKRRLRRLQQALAGIANADAILRFCRRRGSSYRARENEDPGTGVPIPREEFFRALEGEIEQRIAPADRPKVLTACARHLNRTCHRDAEVRPARFDNRRPGRCHWQGCTAHVPRADNDCKGRLQQALFAWLLPIFAVSPHPDRLRRSVQYWIGQLDAAARSYRKTRRPDATGEGVAAQQAVAARVKAINADLLARVRREVPAQDDEKENPADTFLRDWKTRYRRFLSQVLRGGPRGRERYCRRHAEQWVSQLLAEQKVPPREDRVEADRLSRQQQIIADRLWRLVEGRLLPLAGGRIDRVVVERIALEILAGPRRARQALSEEKVAAFCVQGPQLGFKDHSQMFVEEFAGRCAYCGAQGSVEPVEQLLPRSSFPFDPYFNLVPACASCTRRKGARTALEAGMVIHATAYEAYRAYVHTLAVPHVYHTIKVGLLKLLQRPVGGAMADRVLGLLASNLLRATTGERAPRALAHFLASRLQQQTGHRAEVAIGTGRQTALYRSLALPGHEASAVPAERDLRQHAVGAILLGCQMPSAVAVATTKWRSTTEIQAWAEQVRRAAPATEHHLPLVSKVAFVRHFERDLGGNYCAIDLCAFNWNRQRKMTHKLDPFGQTVSAIPLKRKRAADVLMDLKDARKRSEQIRTIAHPSLRACLAANPGQAARCFVAWLQQTVQAGLAPGERSHHPADQARRRALEQFVQNTPEQLVSGAAPIPDTIGVRCLIPGSTNKLDVTRLDRTGKISHRYQADPVIRELYVGYRLRNGVVNRTSPIVFSVNQNGALRRLSGRKPVPVDGPEDSALRGRPLGSLEELKDFETRWCTEFDELCQRDALAVRFRITQGCVIEKTDGTCFQFRNFDKHAPWMKDRPFHHIHQIHPSPFRVMGRLAGGGPAHARPAAP